jgi:hypothetical protein
MIERLLQRHLATVGRDYRRAQLLGRLAALWAGAALVGLGVFLAGYAFGWHLPYAPWVVGLAAAGAAGSLWRRWRSPGIDARALARRIEQEEPRLHALLLTAVEQQADPVTGDLNYLQQRVVEEALAYNRRQPWGQRWVERRFLMQSAHALALLALLATLVALWQTRPRHAPALANWLAGVEVSPGDTSLERGNNLVVLARFERRVPREATLVVTPRTGVAQRVSLVRNLADPVFGGSVPAVQDDLSYRVEYGDAQTRAYQVTVFEYPKLEQADARLTFPTYTGLPDKTIENTRRVSAVQGTSLEYTFRLNKPVTSARLLAHDRSEVALTSDATRSNVYQAAFTLDLSRRYALLLADEAGRTNQLPAEFVIEVLTNRVPEIRLASPRGDQRVSALEEIAFDATVSDDFGLRGYGLAYNVTGQETRFVELGQAAPPHEKRRLEHLLALEGLGLQPDQLITYFIWADDVGPDGQIRRTFGDMYLAEVRPFDEVFREGQSSEGSDQQPQQSGEQNPSEQLLELQKQILNATWTLQRREWNPAASAPFKQDAQVILESQEHALEQAQALRDRAQDARTGGLVEAVEQEMGRAVEHLEKAAADAGPKALPPALAAEQSAYQALLRLQAREYEVSRSRSRSGRSSGRGERAQRQLDQLELRQEEDRYETPREATPPQNAEQREQLRVLNRLKELAQRQQDLNDRLQELQTALQEAKTEAEREEIRRRLKRLREEELEMLADVDEVRQRMERPENASHMAEARRQLDQARSELQRAAEAIEAGAASQALASGARARDQLDELREDFRRRTLSQFAEDLRQMRNQARQLARDEQQIGQQLEQLGQTPRPTLSTTEERQALADQLGRQQAGVTNLFEQMRRVTEQAETADPRLAKQLYDTHRQAAQDDASHLAELTQELLERGALTRPVYDVLRAPNRPPTGQSLQATETLLREGHLAEARLMEAKSRAGLEDLKRGIERAAEGVLGDDVEALRLAQRELQELSRQLDGEIAQAERPAGGAESPETPAAPASAQSGQPTPTSAQTPPGESSSDTAGRSPDDQAAANQAQGEAADAGRAGAANRAAASDRSGNRPASAQAGSDGAARRFFEAAGGNNDGGTTGSYGPLTGPDYRQWSDRLADVEELVDVPEVRADIARVRDRARAVRIEFKRHATLPQWSLVKTEIAGPLLEIRRRVEEELARRQSAEALVPIDRDPVPRPYSELVRRYYEQLGGSE